MFTSTLNTIITALETIADFRTVGVWQGDAEELFATAQKIPSAHVILSAAAFREARIIGVTSVPADLLWSVVVISQNLLNRKSGTVESLALIEKLLAPSTPSQVDKGGLAGLATDYGRLWPVHLQLLAAESGKAMYGFQFQLTKEY